MLLRSGSLYNIYYGHPITNPPDRRIVFVLFSPGVGKAHCLQLSAKQLSLIDRVKLINIISKLSKVPAAQKWNGRILYGIFKKYAPSAVRSCYRTLWANLILRYSLINYGLNDPSSFLIEEKNFMDKTLYQQSKAMMVSQLLNRYTSRAYTPIQKTFAKPINNKPVGKEPSNTIDPTVPIVQPNKTTVTGTNQAKPTKNNQTPPNINGGDDII